MTTAIENMFKDKVLGHPDSRRRRVVPLTLMSPPDF